jgi:ABC-type lipoprotein release transport system permease subunit
VLVLRLAWRNLWRYPRRTGIVLLAVAVGIGGVMLSMAVFNGMMVQMVETAIATELGHLQVHAVGFEENPMLRLRLADGGRDAEEALARLPGVSAWSRRVRAEGLVSSSRANLGVRLVGIEPDREARVSALADSIVAGAYLGEGGRRLLVGERLARLLQVDVGSKVVLSVQDLSGDLTGEAYRVAGLFRTASGELDRSTVYLPLAESQRLLALGPGVSELVVVADEGERAARLTRALAEDLGAERSVRTWKELRPALAQMVAIFDQTAWTMYAAVFVAMAFGIANVLLMSVFERTHEIGILVSLGMRPGRLVSLIVVESLLLTGIGLGLGVLAAGGCVLLLADGIDLSRFAEGMAFMGMGTRIVPVIRAYDIEVPLAVALITAFLASLWPALRAVRLRPAEAMRHV